MIPELNKTYQFQFDLIVSQKRLVITDMIGELRQLGTSTICNAFRKVVYYRFGFMESYSYSTMFLVKFLDSPKLLEKYGANVYNQYFWPIDRKSIRISFLKSILNGEEKKCSC